LGRSAFAWTWLARAAFAQPLPEGATERLPLALQLEWQDPSALAPTTKVDFEAQLSSRLGRPAFEGEPGGQALAVSWQGRPEQCRVELGLVSDAGVVGTRVLDSPNGDCRALLPALLTVAALLIESRPHEPEAPEPMPPLPPSTPPPRPAALEAPHGAPPPAQPWVLLSLGAEVGSGLVPEMELGPAAQVAVTPLPHLRVGLGGSVYLPRHFSAGPGIRLNHATVGAFACGMPLSAPLGLGVCGTVKLHRLESTGVSLARPETQRSLVPTLGLALRVEWRLVRRLWWVGSIGADAPTKPIYFYFTPAAGGESILFRQHRLAPSAIVGLTLELP
jgi:hypothetical protein